MLDGITDTVITKDTVRITKTLAGRVITKTNTVKVTVADRRVVDYLNSVIAAQRDSLITVKTQLDATKKQSKTLLWITIWLGVLVIVGVVLTAYRFFK